MLIASRLRAGLRLLRAEGPLALARAMRAALRRDREASASRYPEWVRRYAAPAPVESLAAAPLVSVITPVFDPPPEFLRAAIESVIAQSYANWELILVDDGSRMPAVREMLARHAADPRIRPVLRERTGNISIATNDGLAAARGELVAFLDHDDTLAPDALYRVAREFAGHPDAAIVYSDEDKLDLAGEPAHPNFKPDWNYDLFLSHNVLAHLCAYRMSAVRDAGGLREGFEGAQDYDLALRISERVGPSRIRHLPRVLYHWRMMPGSTAVNAAEKDYAAERARRAVAEHLSRRGVEASVETLAALGAQRVRYPRPPGDVAIVRGADARARNLAARGAAADFLLFLGDGVEPGAGAVDELVAQAARDGVGAAGGLVRDARGAIVNAGFVLGAPPPHVGRPPGDGGYMMRAALVQELTALSVECLCIRRAVFEDAGGFDESLARAFHDVDLCLRQRAKGLRSVFTPFAVLRRAADASVAVAPDAAGMSAHPTEAAILRERWGGLIQDDPAYNPNLSLEAPFTLAWPPRTR